MLTQQIVSGLAAGSLYALMALGLVLLYKTSDIANFAQGDIAMASTFVAYTLLEGMRLPMWAAFLGALAAAAVLGVVIEAGLMRIARKRHVTILGMVMATLGIAMVINAAAGWVWGYDTKSFPYAVAGPPVMLGSVIISRAYLLDLVVALILAVALFAFTKYTRIGTAMRATAQNQIGARLMGISVNRIFAVTWALSSALGAVAGVLIAPIMFLDLGTMTAVQIKGFAAAVIGGFTSLPGAVVGGLLLGVMENLVAGYISTEMKTTFAFLMIIVFLTIKPSGLFGAAVRKKV